MQEQESKLPYAVFKSRLVGFKSELVRPLKYANATMAQSAGGIAALLHKADLAVPVAGQAVVVDWAAAGSPKSSFLPCEGFRLPSFYLAELQDVNGTFAALRRRAATTP